MLSELQQLREENTAAHKELHERIDKEGEKINAIELNIARQQAANSIVSKQKGRFWAFATVGGASAVAGWLVKKFSDWGF